MTMMHLSELISLGLKTPCARCHTLGTCCAAMQILCCRAVTHRNETNSVLAQSDQDGLKTCGDAPVYR